MERQHIRFLLSFHKGKSCPFGLSCYDNTRFGQSLDSQMVRILQFQGLLVIISDDGCFNFSHYFRMAFVLIHDIGTDLPKNFSSFGKEQTCETACLRMGTEDQFYLIRPENDFTGFAGRDCEAILTHGTREKRRASIGIFWLKSNGKSEQFLETTIIPSLAVV